MNLKISHEDMKHRWGLTAKVVSYAESFVEADDEKSKKNLIKAVGALQADRDRLNKADKARDQRR